MKKIVFSLIVFLVVVNVSFAKSAKTKTETEIVIFESSYYDATDVFTFVQFYLSAKGILYHRYGLKRDTMEVNRKTKTMCYYIVESKVFKMDVTGIGIGKRKTRITVHIYNVYKLKKIKVLVQIEYRISDRDKTMRKYLKRKYKKVAELLYEDIVEKAEKEKAKMYKQKRR